MDRRKFLRNSSLLGAGTPLAASPFLIRDTNPKHKESLRVAFVSDIHIKSDPIAEDGMAKAFRHINTLKQKPHFIINGGDAIMDALAADKTRTEEQWNLWNKILAAENRLPLRHIIGNHDVWGWQVPDDRIKSDPLYDKAWVVKQHRLPGRYYSFVEKVLGANGPDVDKFLRLRRADNKHQVVFITPGSCSSHYLLIQWFYRTLHCVYTFVEHMHF